MLRHVTGAAADGRWPTKARECMTSGSGKRVVESTVEVYDLRILLCESSRKWPSDESWSSYVRVMKSNPNYDGGRGRSGYGGAAK